MIIKTKLYKCIQVGFHNDFNFNKVELARNTNSFSIHWLIINKEYNN